MSENKSNPLLKAIENQLGNKPIKWDENDIRKNPAGYSLFSKLVRNRENEQFLNDGRLTETTPNLDYLLSISSDKAQDIDDNEAIMQLLPDINRSAQILISYVLSPTFIDATPELKYIPPENLFTKSVGTKMIDSVKKYMNTGFNLNGRLYDIMYKILFTKGAYTVAVIPESSLDELINPELNKESYSTQVSQLTKDSLEKELDSYMRPCNGLAGKPSKVKLNYEMARESFNYTINGTEVTHGQTNDSDDKVTSFSTGLSGEKLIDTRITVSNEIRYEFPKEIASLSEKELAELSISTEGVWHVKLDTQGRTETLVEYTDDLNIIRQGYIKKQNIDHSVKEKMGLSTESFRGNDSINGSDRAILDKIFKNVDSFINNGYNDNGYLKSIRTNKQTHRVDLNEPLIVEYPVESIIPIYKPGSPEEHIGYLVLHDEEGAPLSKVKPINYYRDLNNQFNSRTNGSKMASSLIQQGRQMFDGLNSTIDEARQIEMLSRIHGNAIIKEILDRTREGEYGKNLDIGDSTEAFRIMFYRALRGQRTRVLFMPKEILTYFAQDFDNKGIGVSLIDKMKVLLSLRIQFMLAQLRAGIMNSIPETVATVRIDEKDPDPKKTLQIAQALMLKSRQNAGLLVGASNVQTIEDRINQSNIRFAIESEHPKVPNIGHEVSRNTADIPQPDNETAEMINRLTQMGSFLPPELIDNSYGIEFAREIIQQNFLVDLAASQIQNSINPYFTDFVKKTILASPKLKKDLRYYIQSNITEIMELINEASDDKINIEGLDKKSINVIIDYLVEKFIAGLVVCLPERINDNEQLINDQIQKTETRIDKALDYMFSSDALPPGIIGEEASNFIDQYRSVIKADIMRKHLMDSGYGAEVFDYINVTEEGTQTYEANKSIRDQSIKAIKAIMEMFKEGSNIAKSTDAVMGANEMTASDDYSSSDSNSDSDSEESDSEGDGDDFGDFGDGGDDEGLDDFGDGDGEAGPNEDVDGSPD